MRSFLLSGSLGDKLSLQFSLLLRSAGCCDSSSKMSWWFLGLTCTHECVSWIVLQRHINALVMQVDRFIRQFSNLFYFLQYKMLTLLFLKPVCLPYRGMAVTNLSMFWWISHFVMCNGSHLV